MSRAENILNMQITIANCIKEEWNLSYNAVSYLMEKYDLLPYIDASYEIFNSMGIKGILEDLKSYINMLQEAER